ncbi:MAG: hypothetical protein WC234_06425 [Endomicrobiaceae bacterium]
MADILKQNLVEKEKPNFKYLVFICSWLVDYKKPLINKRKYFIYPKKEHDKLEVIIGALRPTSGIQMIWLALLFGAKKVDVYGFDFFKTYSFYEKRTLVVPHNFDSEEKWALSMVNNGKITIYGNNKNSRNRVIAQR